MWDPGNGSQPNFEEQENSDLILNTIARGLDPHHNDQEWLWYSDTQSYINEEQSLSYDPVKGILTRQLMEKKAIPQTLEDHPLYIAITSSREDKSKPLDRLEELVYLYRDPEGVYYRFVAENPPLIQRRFNNEWYQAMDPNGKTTLPIAHESGSAWHDGGILWYPLSYTGMMYFTGPAGHPILKLDTNNFQSIAGRAGSYFAGKFGEATANSSILPLRRQVENTNQALQANMHVAAIFLSERRYGETITYLEDVDKLIKATTGGSTRKLSILCRSLMTFSSINHDKSPQAAAVHLRAASILYRLIDIDLINPEGIGPIANYIKASTQSIQKDYDYYGQHINRIPRNPAADKRTFGDIIPHSQCRHPPYPFSIRIFDPLSIRFSRTPLNR
ncbi:unnamed protein product [Sphagnum jensenii]|uniref:Tetratricopeptide repeat protein n=1 Tax=Sphagnum jensenii TaxID=128206 RepID=A0ABP0VC34_9BRYO